MESSALAEKTQLHGLVPLKRFLEVAGVESLQFKKGKGRQFVSTAVGVLFMSATFDKTKEGFITIAGPDVKTKKNESLEGTFWLVNAMVEDGDLITV